MANYIITKNQEFFKKIGDYNYCSLEDMILPDIISIDSETTGLKAVISDIFAAQIGTGENNYLIHCYDDNYTFRDIIPFIEGKELVMHNACLPKSTEVLTTTGWKKIENVNVKDRVFGYEKGLIKEQNIFSLIKEKSEIWELYNTGRSFKSTPDHRWLIKHRKTGKISYKQTQEIDFLYDQIVLNGNYNKKEDFLLTDEELKIFTWAITDGHIAKSIYKKPSKYLYKQIVITQSLKKEQFVNEIRDTILNSDFIFNEIEIKMPGYKSCKRFIINAESTERLLKKINYCENFNYSEFILKLSNRQLKIFIDIFNKAEGLFANKKGFCISQSKKVNSPKRDAIALALYLEGYTISVNEKTVFSKKRIFADSRTLKIKKEPIQDVFCLMTELSNFIVRQDECIFLTGNCFDLGFFYKYGFYPEKTRDTFLASKILYNGIKSYRHDFGAVFKRELDLVYDKTEQKNIHTVKLNTKEAINYCFNDVDKLILLHQHLSDKIDTEGYRQTYDLHCNYIQALAYIEQCGVPLSQERWLFKIQEDIKSFNESEKEVKDYIYKTLPKYRDNQIDLFSQETKINLLLSSSKQMLDIFKAYKIPIHDDKGKESISEKIINKSTHEFVEIWLKYQSASHDLTTFGKNILDKTINNRIYTSYNPILDTARISSRRGDVNTLNLPANERTRKCILAENGYNIIVCDYAGQENIVGADLTGDKTMIASVVNNLDLHCAFARVLYPYLKDLSDEEIIKNYKKERTSAKSPRFAFAYGGNAFTIHKNQGISLEEAQKIEDAYKELHSGIYEYGENKLKEAINLGYIESAYGFKLHLPNFKEFKEMKKKVESITKDDWQLYKVGKLEYKQELKNKENNKPYQIKDQKAYNFFKDKKGVVSNYFKLKSQYFRLCLNNPVQTTSAHQTKSAVITLFNLIKSNNHLGKVRIIIVPHDEIVLECLEELTPYYKEQLSKIMKEEGNKFLTNPILKMNADANFGKDWYEAK